MSAVLAVMFLLVAGTGAGVVLSREPRRQTLAIAVNGVALSLLFVVLRAPDVAYSEIAVGTVLVPLMMLGVLVSLKTDRPKR
jgi:energy-converting hydrogenase B subunit D